MNWKTSTEKIKNIVNNKIVCIMVHGQSIHLLEDHIYQNVFKNNNICWASMGLFTIMEENILNKIEMSLDIVFDCATVAENRLKNYETKIRMPRLEKFISRKEDNLWITSHGITRDSIEPYYPQMYDYLNRIALVDYIFSEDQRGKAMDVPNSVTLLIGSMIAGGAKKIILFGLDGYSGDVKTGIDSFYQPLEHKVERMAALGSIEDPGINRDTGNFKERFPTIVKKYRTWFNNLCEIYNCSPDSEYDMIKKITYNDLEEVING